MGNIPRGRVLAAILIVIVSLSVTGFSVYGFMNTRGGGVLALNPGQLRIVSQAPSITETVFGLGLGDYLVGCTEYCDYPPKLYELILSGKVDNSLNWFSPSLEAVLSLRPTIVLLDGGVGAQVNMYFTLQSQGVASYLVSQGNVISEIESSILQLGSVLKRSTEAQALVNAMETKMNDVQNNVSGQPIRKVLYCAWIDFDPTYGGISTCGSQTFLSEIIQKAGGSNVYASSPSPWPWITIADAAATNPDVIIVSAHAREPYLDPITTLLDMENSPLSSTTAWKNGTIYFVQGQADNIFSRPGPRVAEAVEVLAHLLFPNVFNKPLPSGPPYVINNANYGNYLSSFILE